MKILILGCGSIGERHLKNLKKIFEGEILACDVDAKTRKKIKDVYNVKTFSDYDEALLEKPNAVLICVPTNLHLHAAIKAIENNCHVFVEKPIASDLKGVDELISLARQKRRKIFVGFNFRFNPYLRKVKEMLANRELGIIYSIRAYFGSYLPDRHPGQDYRKDYGGKRQQGGGAILDAGSHIVDYLSWLFGDILEVASYVQRRSKLKIDVEDNVEMLFKFRNGLVANVHIDFLRRPWQHFFELIGEKGTLIWSSSAQKSELKYFDVKEKEWKILLSGVDVNLMYEEEMKNLLASLNGKKRELVDGKEAKDNLFVLHKILESGKKGKFIRIQYEKEWENHRISTRRQKL